MEYKDYYKIMGLQKDTSQDEIKRAYRKLARKFHPDVSKEPDAEARFKEVGEAYEVLKDPEKRAAYDQLGTQWKAGQDFRPPPDWDAGFEFHGGGYAADDTADFSDFFESLFGQRGGFSRSYTRTGGFGRQGFQARGEDSHAKVMINLEDAYNGATHSLSLHTTELGADGQPHVKTRTLNVRIPKGVKQGQHIRLQRQGNPGLGGGPAGDLYLEIEFTPHSLYHVEGHDVYLELPITPAEAVLGGTIKAPTPSGMVDIKIPPGSSSGRKLRLKGRGIPGSSPGDFYVTLKIVVPPDSTSDVQSLYRQLVQKQPFNPRAKMGV